MSKDLSEDKVGTEDIFFCPGHRFPTLRSARGFDALSYLNENDKRIGVEIFDQTKMMNIEGVEQPADHRAVQAINPYMIFQSDPELMRADLAYSEFLQKSIFGLNNAELMATTGKDGGRSNDPGVSERLHLAMLIVARVAYEYDEAWTMRLVATGPNFKLSREQLSLLGHPESMVWSDEERLMLEFIVGVFHGKVSDPLFARAEAAWGRKLLLRYANWVTRYMHLMLMCKLNFTDAVEPRKY